MHFYFVIFLHFDVDIYIIIHQNNSFTYIEGKYIKRLHYLKIFLKPSEIVCPDVIPKTVCLIQMPSSNNSFLIVYTINPSSFNLLVLYHVGTVTQYNATGLQSVKLYRNNAVSCLFYFYILFSKNSFSFGGAPFRF